MQLLRGENKRGIHQFTPGITFGDAICNEALYIRKILRGKGYSSEVYAKWIDKRVRGIRGYESFVPQEDDLLIYHASTNDEDVLPRIKDLPNKKVMIYHNITPAHYFKRYNAQAFKASKEGREALKTWKRFFDLAFADSPYNASELESMGYKGVRVFPIIYDFGKLEGLEEDSLLASRFGDKYIKNIVFWGRIAPNKRQLDLIRAFFIYNKYINSLSRLFIVGHHGLAPKYVEELKEWIVNLRLENCVFLPGLVSDKEFITYVKHADLFLSMSEHEGFFVPALECMHYKIPMLLYKSTAVPDTAGDAAIYFAKKDFDTVAEMMHLILSSEKIRNKLGKLGEKRLKYFQDLSFMDRFISDIERLLT